MPVLDERHLFADTLAWLQAHLDQEVTVRDLADRAAMSPRTFARRFLASTGVTPYQWIVRERVRLAQRMLETTDLPIDAVAVNAGFCTAGNLRTALLCASLAERHGAFARVLVATDTPTGSGIGSRNSMTLWRGRKMLILASQSRARKMLLANAGIDFEVVPADIDERAIQQKSGVSAPNEIASLLAREKALWTSRRAAGHYVIGADQTLALGDRLFNKPGGRTAAGEQIRALSGQTHTLHSAIAVVRDGQIVFKTVASARMTMRSLLDADIAAYLDAAGDAVTGSVGAYQLEGLGVHLFERIEGDHSTILGLPLLPLLDFLRSQHLLAF